MGGDVHVKIVTFALIFIPPLLTALLLPDRPGVAAALALLYLFALRVFTQKGPRLGTVILFSLSFLTIASYIAADYFSAGTGVALLRFPVVIVGLTALLLRSGERVVPVLRANWDVMLFGAWAVLGAFVSPHPTHSLVYALWLLGTLALLLLVLDRYADRRQALVAVNRVMLAAYAAPVVLGLVFLPVYLSVANRMDFGGAQLHGWAGAVVVGSVLALDQLEVRRRSKLGVFVNGALVLLAVLGVIVSGTRSAVLALAAVLLLFLLRNWRRKALRYVVVGIMAMVVGQQWTSAFLVNRYRSTFVERQVSSSDELRLGLIRANIRFGLAHPLTGGGLLSSKEIGHAVDPRLPAGFTAHNTYVQIFSEMGIAGFALFGLVFIRSLRLLRRAAGRKELVVPWLLLLGPAAIISVFESNLTPGQPLFFPLWSALLLPRLVPGRPAPGAAAQPGHVPGFPTSSASRGVLPV
jgi:O-antigen ligase